MQCDNSSLELVALVSEAGVSMCNNRKEIANFIEKPSRLCMGLVAVGRGDR